MSLHCKIITDYGDSVYAPQRALRSELKNIQWVNNKIDLTFPASFFYGGVNFPFIIMFINNTKNKANMNGWYQLGFRVLGF